MDAQVLVGNGRAELAVLIDDLFTIEPEAGRDASVKNASNVFNPAAAVGDFRHVLVLDVHEVLFEAVVSYLDGVAEVLGGAPVLRGVLRLARTLLQLTEPQALLLFQSELLAFDPAGLLLLKRVIIIHLRKFHAEGCVLDGVDRLRRELQTFLYPAEMAVVRIAPLLDQALIRLQNILRLVVLLVGPHRRDHDHVAVIRY